MTDTIHIHAGEKVQIMFVNMSDRTKKIHDDHYGESGSQLGWSEGVQTPPSVGDLVTVYAESGQDSIIYQYEMRVMYRHWHNPKQIEIGLKHL